MAPGMTEVMTDSPEHLEFAEGGRKEISEGAVDVDERQNETL